MGSPAVIRIASNVLIAAALVASSSSLAYGTAFNVSESFNLFGQQQNFTCPGPGAGGVCGAIAAVNSFAFLQNMYPGIYGTSLLPNYNATNMTDMTDATAFATGSWGEPTFAHSDDTPTADVDIGYYSRFLPVNMGGLGATDPNATYLQTKMDWFSDHVQGNTTIFAQFNTPTVAQLAAEIMAQEDVEFFVKDQTNATFYHALTLTGISCDANNNCSITYQDPNQPTVNQSVAISINGAGAIQFTGVPGSGFAGAVFIDAAFAESPVPEPMDWVLVSTGVIALCGLRMRYRGLK